MGRTPLGINSQLAEDLQHVRLLGVQFAMGGIANMGDDIGFEHLFQGSAERGDEFHRQIGDEAHRVGQYDVASARQA